MANIWERFNGMATADEVNDAKENLFERPTEGTFEYEFMSAEPAETNQGQPLMKFKFRNVETNKLLGTSFFLSNVNYPENTPREIAKAIDFLNNVSGEEVIYTSMGALADALTSIETGKHSMLNIHYRNADAKYPNVTFVGDAEETPF